MTPFLRFLLAAALVGLTACATNRPEAQWVSDELAAPSENVLWQVTVLTLEKEGYPLGSGVDPTRRSATSGWRMSLLPFRGEGWRERAAVRTRPVAPGRFQVEVRVEKELNQDLVRPLDPTYADWEPAPDNTARAKLLLEKLKAWLGAEIDVGEKKKSELR